MTGPTQTPGDPNPDEDGRTSSQPTSAPDYGQAPPPPSYDQPVYGQPDYGQAAPSYGQTPPAYGRPDPNQQYDYQQRGAYPPPPGAFPPPPGSYDAGYAAANAPGYAQPATVGLRLGARLIDGLLIGIPLWIIFNVLIAAASNSDSLVVVVWILDIVLTPLIMALYYAQMESSSGQTFGHRWLGMRTAQHGTGQLLTFNDSFKRNIVLYIPLVTFVSIITWIVAAVTINGDPENRGFHDKLANSQVLKVS